MDRRKGVPGASLNPEIGAVYQDKPLELSNYLLYLTKERMILEAMLHKEELVLMNPKRTDKSATSETAVADTSSDAAKTEPVKTTAYID